VNAASTSLPSWRRLPVPRSVLDNRPHEFDAATGLYDLRARYYAPYLGRFLSQDALPFDLNNPVEINRYIYTADNPLNLADPSGRMADYLILTEERTEDALDAGAAYRAIWEPAIEAASRNVARRLLIKRLALAGVGLGLGFAYLFEALEWLAWAGETEPGPMPAPRDDPWSEPEPQPSTEPRRPPTPQPTPTQEPNYVYRVGPDRPKTVRLYRKVDWMTGLSFLDSPPSGPSLKFRVKTLEANGYVVR
jgi:RHS repeat-associated protein